MSKLAISRIAKLSGFIVGTLIGVLGAPEWEMAGLFVGLAAAIAGASAAAFSASARQRLVPAAFAVALSAGTLALLSQSNPQWVTIRCTLLVVAAGAAGCLMGSLLRELLPSLPPSNGPETPPG